MSPVRPGAAGMFWGMIHQVLWGYLVSTYYHYIDEQLVHAQWRAGSGYCFRRFARINLKRLEECGVTNFECHLYVRSRNLPPSLK